MLEYSLVFLAQRFRRLDRNPRWHSVSRISIRLLPALLTPATSVPALGLGRALSLEPAHIPLQRSDAIGRLVGGALERLVVGSEVRIRTLQLVDARS
jgi:hypothetical protein